MRWLRLFENHRPLRLIISQLMVVVVLLLLLLVPSEPACLPACPPRH